MVWGCLYCPPNLQCSDAQKNSVTNLLVLQNALELVALGFGGNETASELMGFARKQWVWLKQADVGVAGLVDYESGVVYDKLRPVQAAARANETAGLKVWHCCAGGCEDAVTGEVSYAACEKDYSNGVGCGALNPNPSPGWAGHPATKANTRQLWTAADCRANLGGDSDAACGAPGSHAGATNGSRTPTRLQNFCTAGWANLINGTATFGHRWPASWATPSRPLSGTGWMQSPDGRGACRMQSKGNYIGSCCSTLRSTAAPATADCGAIYTYNQGLLIGVLVQMDSLQRANVTTIDATLDHLSVALKAFRVTTRHLQEHGFVSDGPLVKDSDCADRDNFWFRAIFFWNALKLFLHLRTLQAPEYAAAAEEVGAAITKNWRHLAGVLDKTSSLAPDDWFPKQAFAAPNGSSVPSGYMVVGAGNCVRSSIVHNARLGSV